MNESDRSPAEEMKAVHLRLPASLIKKLQVKAREGRRSMNAEACIAIERWVLPYEPAITS